jgi:hypothetical protein
LGKIVFRKKKNVGIEIVDLRDFPTLFEKIIKKITTSKRKNFL